jgi:hypothetical protein
MSINIGSTRVNKNAKERFQTYGFSTLRTVAAAYIEPGALDSKPLFS